MIRSHLSHEVTRYCVVAIIRCVLAQDLTHKRILLRIKRTSKSANLLVKWYTVIGASPNFVMITSSISFEKISTL